MVLVGGEKWKKSAPYLVSITFTDDDVDPENEEACYLVICPELEHINGPGLSAVTDGPALNVAMGSTILQGRTDMPKEKRKVHRRSMLKARYDLLKNESNYKLPGIDDARVVYMTPVHGPPISDFWGCMTFFCMQRLLYNQESALQSQIMLRKIDVDQEKGIPCYGSCGKTFALALLKR